MPKKRGKEEEIKIRNQLYKGLFVLLIDQLSKIIIRAHFLPGESLPIIKNIFHISLVCNKGIAFGAFSKAGPALTWILPLTVTAIVFIFILYKKDIRGSKSSQFFLSLIVSGAIGNLIDRLRLGYVVDFLDFRIWPVFNIADAAITVGTILLILHMLRKR